jgi:hypothetical protein
MQASKIQTGAIYAIRDDAAQLVMFRVNAVTTRRTGTNPKDYHSTVDGHILNDDRSPREEVKQLDPDKILGAYTQYVELVEKEARVEAARKATVAARVELQLDVTRQLYRVIGEPMPNDVGNYKALVRAHTSGTEITISPEVFERLLAALRSVNLTAPSTCPTQEGQGGHGDLRSEEMVR